MINGLILKWGNFGSTDPTTFYGAMETICDGLLTKYPGKTIIFITPTEQNSGACNTNNKTGYTVADFANTIKKFVLNTLYQCLIPTLVLEYTL